MCEEQISSAQVQTLYSHFKGSIQVNMRYIRLTVFFSGIKKVHHIAITIIIITIIILHEFKDIFKSLYLDEYHYLS